MLDHIPNEDLDSEPFIEIEAKWPVEAEARIDAFERGELKAVDVPTALREHVELIGKYHHTITDWDPLLVLRKRCAAA